MGRYLLLVVLNKILTYQCVVRLLTADRVASIGVKPNGGVRADLDRKALFFGFASVVSMIFEMVFISS